ncbi:MAG: DUF3488 and transglutaminase-like domain-containing protein [Ectothiorhodospiraceae bacterium]|jgi:transglutaminase-like putative cysteine protease
MAALDPASRLPTRTMLALLIVVGAVAVPHLARQPLWLVALVVALGAWRLVIARRGERLPPRGLRLLLTLGAGAAVLLHYGTINGRDAGLALLTLMTALKLLEMRSRRDTMVVLYLAYFLIVTQFLYSQAPVMAVYLLVATWATTVMLVTVNRPTGAGLARAHLRTAFTLLVQALPVMLLLFVVFPRIPGPLWKMPDAGGAGVTGLSNSMSPGDISSLSQSDSVAFRAEFDTAPPPRALRYWRGPVFSRYDGRTWQPDPDLSRRPAVAFRGDPTDYTVTLEPNGQHWLLALDLPAVAPAGAEQAATGQIRADTRVKTTRRYRIRSYTNYRLQPHLTSFEKHRYTALPPDAHPRARELARGWRRQASSARAVARRALGYFRNQPFVYTLNPAPLPGDTVDGFLFSTREGFCEHYASAFVVLMRAAGIPARVVTGYQGGRMNPQGDYLIVRQSDAHAWAEVWLGEGTGWQRYDPTAAVAPERVRAGLGEAVPQGDPVPTMAIPGSSWLKNLRLTLDLFEANWNRWILGYGPELQQRLLGDLGFGGRWGGAWALTAGLLAALAMSLTVALWPRRRGDEPVQRSWERFHRKMTRAGVPPRQGEGPRDYTRRVARTLPGMAQPARRIGELYIALRYGPSPTAAQRSELKRRVSALRVPKRNRGRPPAGGR